MQSNWAWENHFHHLQAQIQGNIARDYLDKAKEAQQQALFHLAVKEDCYLTAEEAAYAKAALEEVQRRSQEP